MTRYRLLAVDVDGTLVGPDQCVSRANVLALQRAKQAGLAVCLCTGRAYAETSGVWRDCGLRLPADPIICVGGALVAEADTGRTLHMEPLDRPDAVAAGELLIRHGFSIVALVDRWRWGFDYYLTDGGDAQAAFRDWFDKHDCIVRRVPSLNDVPESPELLRLTALVPPGRTAELEQVLRERFTGRLELHHIFVPTYRIHVLECFGRGVNKWTGVRYVAQGMRVGPVDIVAIGDDINDLPMIRQAGLGVAMANAPQFLREAARHVARSNENDGVAEFVDQLLAGRFD